MSELGTLLGKIYYANMCPFKSISVKRLDIITLGFDLNYGKPLSQCETVNELYWMILTDDWVFSKQQKYRLYMKLHKHEVYYCIMCITRNSLLNI